MNVKDDNAFAGQRVGQEKSGYIGTLIRGFTREIWIKNYFFLFPVKVSLTLFVYSFYPNSIKNEVSQ